MLYFILCNFLFVKRGVLVRINWNTLGNWNTLPHASTFWNIGINNISYGLIFRKDLFFKCDIFLLLSEKSHVFALSMIISGLIDNEVSHWILRSNCLKFWLLDCLGSYCLS